MRLALVALVALVACNRHETEDRATVSASELVDVPTSEGWPIIIDVQDRNTWSPWIVGLEQVGRGDSLSVGLQYRAAIQLDKHQVPAEIEVVELIPMRRLAWRVTPLSDSRLSDLVETVEIEPQTDLTSRVTYQITYKAHPSLLREARPLMERMAHETIKLLADRLVNLRSPAAHSPASTAP